MAAAGVDAWPVDAIASVAAEKEEEENVAAALGTIAPELDAAIAVALALALDAAATEEDFAKSPRWSWWLSSRNACRAARISATPRVPRKVLNSMACSR